MFLSLDPKSGLPRRTFDRKTEGKEHPLKESRGETGILVVDAAGRIRYLDETAKAFILLLKREAVCRAPKVRSLPSVLFEFFLGLQERSGAGSSFRRDIASIRRIYSCRGISYLLRAVALSPGGSDEGGTVMMLIEKGSKVNEAAGRFSKRSSGILRSQALRAASLINLGKRDAGIPRCRRLDRLTGAGEGGALPPPRSSDGGRFPRRVFLRRPPGD